MTKKRKTRAIDKDQYRSFLTKAKDFASMMDISLEEGKWNSAGLQAVHTVISASDAVIVFYGGVRSAALDHREVVGLLHDIIGEAASAAGKHLSRIIAKKNLVEYEGRLVTETEARDMVKHATSPHFSQDGQALASSLTSQGIFFSHKYTLLFAPSDNPS